MKSLTRRDFLISAGAGAVALMAGDSLIARAEGRKPNLIYVLADDLGYGELGCYGQKRIFTPRLDRLAAGGMRFTDHYSGSTVCAPSRCSLLTGMHTGHCYIRGNREYFPEGQEPLAPGTATAARLLKNAGYATGIIGKWGLGGPRSTGVPNLQGFDYFYGYLCQRQAHDHFPGHLWRNDEKVKLDGRTYSQDLFTREALNFIRTNRSRPFFLMLTPIIPHYALQVPEIDARYADTGWPKKMQRLATMITRLDDGVGQVMDLLKELGLENDTLVMFSSDNGPHEEGGADPAFFNSAGPFRGIKRDLYEGGIRVPLMARWPGRIPAGAVSGHISAFWDMLPTWCELAGIDAPAGIDGISMVPSLTGRQKAQRGREYLYWEFHERGGRQAVRMGDWKAVRLGVKRDPDAPVELYNLHDDPAESRDVAADHPAIVSRMREIFSDARTESAIFRFGK